MNSEREFTLHVLNTVIGNRSNQEADTVDSYEYDGSGGG